MKKASILTFQFPNNYGAVLQIYALSETLKNLGLEVDVIDYRPIEMVDRHNLTVNWKYNTKTYGIFPTIISTLKKMYRLRRNYKRSKGFKNFKEQYLNLTNDFYRNNTEIKEKLPIYDYYFVGSDQVWNPSFLSLTEGTYFLNFAPENSKKISYAASIAEVTDNNSTLKMFEENLKRFDAISVRETSAKLMLKNLTKKEIDITLDPTLLIEKKEWEKLISKDENIYDDFILVYDLEVTDTIINLTNQLSEKTGYKVVSFSNKNHYDNTYFSFIEKGPIEFLKLFSEAKIVITSSFHGTAFSVIFEKEFYTVPHTSRGSRMIDFLKSVDLETQIIENSSDFIQRRKINYEKANDKLRILREDSLNFIKNAVNS